MKKRFYIPIFILVGLLAGYAESGSFEREGNSQDAPSVIEEIKCSNWSEITAGNGDFLLQNNKWGSSSADQCIFTTSRGAVGWNWSRDDEGNSPNFPELLTGSKPWGTSSNQSKLPIKVSKVESLNLRDLSSKTDVNGTGKWNTAVEIWLTSEKPDGDVSGSIEDEIIILLEYRGMDEGRLVERNAVGQGENSYDLYRYETGPGNYYQFRNDRNEVPEEIDLNSFIEFVTEKGSDKWVASLEIGNEYWGNTSGRTVIKSLSYEVNFEPSSLS